MADFVFLPKTAKLQMCSVVSKDRGELRHNDFCFYQELPSCKCVVLSEKILESVGMK